MESRRLMDVGIYDVEVFYWPDVGGRKGEDEAWICLVRGLELGGN